MSGLFPGSPRPKRSMMSRYLPGLLIGVVIVAGVFLEHPLENAQCPASTFDLGQLPSAGAGAPLALVGCGFFLILPMAFRAKYTIYASVLGLIGCAAVFVNNVDYYFCATPTKIVIRSGYLDTPRNLTWDDVEGVHAWCWTATPRGGRSYQGSTLRVSFRDGEEIPLGLVDGRRILMNKYMMIRRSLENRRYRYSADSSVTPASCPPELYPLLRDWTNE